LNGAAGNQLSYGVADHYARKRISFPLLLYPQFKSDFSVRKLARGLDMAELYASVAMGTAATLLATILFLLRAEFRGRRPAVALTRRWVAATPRTSGVVLALLFTVAASCFALIGASEWSGSATALSGFDSHFVQTTSSELDDNSDAGQALEALRSYTDQISGEPASMAAAQSGTNSVSLPDVDTMIAKLISRLEKQPNDVNGWKMLGWSYLNTGRPEEAVKAYESALNLEPGNPEIKKGLEAAKSAQAATPNSQSNSFGPTGDDIKSAANLPDAQRKGMIHDMVDRLAARLETSPNDENGWLRLMSSRTTLGEKDAAKTALVKALAAFAGDAAARTRLIAAARELGLTPD
jgi:cytochrome c-type biogenesis protein CcmH